MISTKTNTKIKETVVKEVSTKLNINKRHVKTHVKIDMDGKTVWDEEGHSLVSNFGRYLEFLMCGTSPEAYTHYNYTPWGTVSRRNGKLSLILAGQYYPFSTEHDILIYAPDYPDLHLVKIPVVSYTQYSPYTIITGFDISGSEYDGLIDQNVPISTQHRTAGTYKFSGYSAEISYLLSETAYLRVGVNGTAVAIDDRHVFLPPLNAGNTTVTFSSNTSLDESYLTFSASFTNNTDAPIAIREVLLKTVGTYGNNGGTNSENTWSLLLARDVIDEITIPIGRTLTVAYTIMSKIERATGTSEANIDSGFTNNLLSGLAGVITTQKSGVMIQENGASRTFDNTNSYELYGNWMFCGSSQARATSRINRIRSFRGLNLDQWKPGVVLCSNINATQDIQNYSIVDEIDNGEGIGQLLYLQSWGEAGVETPDSYSFTLKRLVHNVSGEPIEVKALALVCVGKTDTSRLPSSVANNMTCLLAQTNLDPTEFFTIPNGKMCIVSYTITIEV